jgi:hypothetical protein
MNRDILAFLKTTVVASAGTRLYLPLRDGTPGAVFCRCLFYVRATS